jgi:hypothetical protein
VGVPVCAYEILDKLTRTLGSEYRGQWDCYMNGRVHAVHYVVLYRLGEVMQYKTLGDGGGRHTFLCHGMPMVMHVTISNVDFIKGRCLLFMY